MDKKEKDKQYFLGDFLHISANKPKKIFLIYNNKTLYISKVKYILRYESSNIVL